jgi:uncharacterized damage-inducible protein DinB
LCDTERRRERGTFFGSIHKTLSHLMWGHGICMNRLEGTPKPSGGIAESQAGGKPHDTDLLSMPED